MVTGMMPAFTTLSGSVSNVCGWILKDLKLTAFILALVLFCSSFEAVNTVLPSYIPVLGVPYYVKDSLVQQYFDLGLNDVEIISFLLCNLCYKFKSQANEENSSKERPHRAAKL